MGKPMLDTPGATTSGSRGFGLLVYADQQVVSLLGKGERGKSSLETKASSSIALDCATT